MSADPAPIETIWMLFFLGFLGVMSLVAIYGGNRAKHRRAERRRTGRVGLHWDPRHGLDAEPTDRRFRDQMEALGRAITGGPKR